MTISSERIIELLLPDSNYLEIGISSGSTFLEISAVCENSFGCDPNLKPHLAAYTNLWKLTSDDFFLYHNYLKFDVIFIDGLHTAEQAMTDFVNCVNQANIGTVILIDDVFPDSIASSKRSLGLYRCSRAMNLISSVLKPVGWQGDVWRLVMALRSLEGDFNYRTIYTQNGKKVQTLVWGPSMGRIKLDIEKCISMLPPRGKPTFKLFGQQPNSLEQIPFWFNPETFTRVLELLKGIKSS